MTAHDPYTPPAAVVEDLLPDEPRQAPFYVVSMPKLVVLFVCTLGLYQLFWFYMHWRHWKAGRNETIWPVARAIFALFYTHALARRIRATLAARGLPAHRATAALATLYVVATALDWGSALAWPWISSRIPAEWIWIGEWGSLLLMPVVGTCLVGLQRVANAACGDPHGRTNRRLTLANLAWIVLGVSATVWVIYMAEGVAV